MKIEVTSQDLVDKAGFGKTPEESLVDKSSTEEKAEEVESLEDEQQSEESKVESETEEVKEATEELEEKPKTQRTVPEGRLKKEIHKRKELEASLSEQVANGVKEALASLIKADKKDELPDIVKKAAQDLAEDTGLDEDGVEKLLRKAKELSATNELPEDVKIKLDKLDKLEAEFEKSKQSDKLKAEKELFENEWSDVLPSLKKQFPNASDAMLKEAKEKMDEISHTNKYHDKEMDYIVYKESKLFETILKSAPKNRGAEQGKQIGIERDVDDNVDNVQLEEMTPELMKRRIQKEINNPTKSNTEYTDIIMHEPIN